jgi:hypothetical protein
LTHDQQITRSNDAIKDQGKDILNLEVEIRRKRTNPSLPNFNSDVAFTRMAKVGHPALREGLKALINRKSPIQNRFRCYLGGSGSRNLRNLGCPLFFKERENRASLSALASTTGPVNCGGGNLRERHHSSSGTA